MARELAGIMDAAATSGDRREDLRALIVAFRRFAHSNPEAYRLLFARLPEGAEMDPAVNARSSAAVVRAAGALAGSEHALDAARTVVAWAHGFIDMELAGAFRLGGDVEDAFEFGVDRLARALEEEPAREAVADAPTGREHVARFRSGTADDSNSSCDGRAADGKSTESSLVGIAPSGAIARFLVRAGSTIGNDSACPAQLMDHHAAVEIAEHVHAYAGTTAYLIWHDAWFDDPLYLRKEVREEDVRALAAKFRFEYRSYD